MSNINIPIHNTEQKNQYQIATPPPVIRPRNGRTRHQIIIDDTLVIPSDSINNQYVPLRSDSINNQYIPLRSDLINNQYVPLRSPPPRQYMSGFLPPISDVQSLFIGINSDDRMMDYVMQLSMEDYKNNDLCKYNELTLSEEKFYNFLVISKISCQQS